MSPSASATDLLTPACAVLRERRDALLAAWLACVGLPDDRAVDVVVRDVSEALGRSLDVLGDALANPSHDDRAALSFLRGHIRRTVLRGVRGPSLLRWCHQLERIVWDELATAAAPEHLLPAARRVMEFVEALNEVCAAAYEETQHALAEAGDAVRSRLVHALVGGEDVEASALRPTAEACGLAAGRPVVVAVLRPAAPFTDGGQSAVVLAALAGSLPGTAVPAGVLGGAVVAVAAVDDDGLPAFVGGLRKALRRVRDRGVVAHVGVSVVHDDRRRAPEAHREALLALDLTAPDRPLVALSEQSVLDYLVLRAGDRTAWKLVPAALRQLLADPGHESRGLVTTVLALAACDGNVRSAAHRLGVHPNTVHGRLSKVRDVTDLDPRRFEDLTVLCLAARLARPVR